MLTRSWLIACLLPASVGAQIPPDIGWYELPSTDLRTQCPPNDYLGSGYDFNFHCQNVTGAWSGATVDTIRHQLLIWGGGHGDYYGNEIYALDLVTLTMKRLTDPVVPIGDGSCTSELTPFDGTQPNGRHTYDGMVYMPTVDRMWAFSGSLSCGSGGGDDVTWTFNPADNTWLRMSPTGDSPSGSLALTAAWDPNRDVVFLHVHNNFYRYEYAPGAGVYTNLSDYEYLFITLHGVIDPVRDVFIEIGSGHQYIVDMSAAQMVREDLASTGGDPIIAAQAPGLAYDPTLDRIVAWAGGDTVYLLDVDARTWTTATFANGPGAAFGQGTFGRWAYVPSLGVFITTNDVDDNAFSLRLAEDAIDTTPPAPPTGLAVR